MLLIHLGTVQFSTCSPYRHFHRASLFLRQSVDSKWYAMCKMWAPYVQSLSTSALVSFFNIAILDLWSLSPVYDLLFQFPHLLEGVANQLGKLCLSLKCSFNLHLFLPTYLCTYLCLSTFMLSFISFCLTIHSLCILHLECSLNFPCWAALPQTELWPDSVLSCREDLIPDKHSYELPNLCFFFPC